MTIFNKWLYEFETYRLGNLVYLRTLKCASSYYAKFFLESGWQKSTADNIDWSKDHVFSFIMDPHVRRVKGLTEFVVSDHKQDLLKFGKIFWGGVLYLDMHSIPYNICYGDYIEQIDWIPLDLHDDPLESRQATLNLLTAMLNKYDLSYDFPSELQHESSPEKLEIYNKIWEITDTGNFAMHLGLEKDIDLYSRVVSNISPWLIGVSDWDTISWKHTEQTHD